MEQAITLLEAVKSTMNTISVVGINNQDKFVGCYNAIETAIRQLKETPKQEEKNDG